MRGLPMMPTHATKRKVAATSLPSSPTVMSTPTDPPFRTYSKPTPTSSSSQPSNTKSSATQVPAMVSTHKRSRQPKSGAQSSGLKHTKPVVSTHQLYNDRLGRLVGQLCHDFQNAESWEAFVNNFRGRSYLSPNLDQVDHPAVDLLKTWRDQGVPAMTSSPPWSKDQLDACIQRGCHRSATEHADFLREEMSEFIENKFWVVLPYELARELPSLQLSPSAVKDERDRKPRLLSDHSWDWGWPSVNESTLPHAPPESMQFGKALDRILYQVRHSNPKFGPPRLCKHDIKDGFYRMFLRAQDCPRLALVLPRYADEPQLVAIPMSSTMGWGQSPPTFSAMSETACDHANRKMILSPTYAPPHRLEEHALPMDDLSRSFVPRPREPEDSVASDLLLAQATEPIEPEPPHVAPPSNMMFQRPLASNDVFVDDFIQLGQGGKKRMHTIRRHLLHALDEILAQPNADEKHRNEAVSLKKMLKGDGSWSTRKLILGWIIDTVRQTIELPPHRKETLAAIFDKLARTHRVSNKDWESILGKLRFVSVAIPGSAGLFSALQLALQKANGNRIRITKSLRSHIDAFSILASSLCHRPTHLAEVVPQEPTLLGSTDAAKPGMGGVYFDADGRSYVWRFPFPEDVQAQVISSSNPGGTVTNSDLEHCALIAQAGLMSTTHDTAYATLGNLTDNTPARSRVHKGAISDDGPAAQLCTIAALHQREHRYCHQAWYIPGPANVMSDDASRLQHLTDAAFLAHYEQVYPQSQPWTLLRLPPDLASLLLLGLRSTLPPPLLARKLVPPRTRSSLSGLPSAMNLGCPLPSITSRTPKTAYATSSSLACATEKPAKPASLSELMQWKPPYYRLARGSPTWVHPILASPTSDRTETIPYSLLSSRASATKMPLPVAPTRSTPPSSSPSVMPLTLNTPSGDKPTPMSSTSASLPSSGSSDLLNTPTPWKMVAPRPSASWMSTSTSMARSTPPRPRL